jgi:hypothetical protein
MPFRSHLGELPSLPVEAQPRSPTAPQGDLLKKVLVVVLVAAVVYMAMTWLAKRKGETQE